MSITQKVNINISKHLINIKMSQIACSSMVNFAFFLCVISILANMVCSVLSVYYWIDLEENILQQLKSVELIPNFLGFALSVISLITSCIIYVKYKKYKIAFRKLRTGQTEVSSSVSSSKYMFYTD